MAEEKSLTSPRGSPREELPLRRPSGANTSGPAERSPVVSGGPDRTQGAGGIEGPLFQAIEASEETSYRGREGPGDIEAKMQKVSLVVSLLGLGSMVVGFVEGLSAGIPRSVPGGSVLPLSRLVHLSAAPLSLDLMSAGIVLLGLLPIARVLLALWFYVRRRDVAAVLVALVVCLELLVSIETGS